MKTTSPNKIICTIIKDEQLYLEEWIQYHLQLGFDEIYLFEDAGSSSHKEITDKFNNVYLERYEDYIKDTAIDRLDSHQSHVYKKFLKEHLGKDIWCAFTDIDEFIRLEEDHTLDDICEEYSYFAGVSMAWNTIGASGHICRPEANLISEYPDKGVCLKQDCRYSHKSFVNMRRVKEFTYSSHYVEGLVDIYKQNISMRNAYERRDFKKIWIDHYFTKSFEDWVLKDRRGCVVHGYRHFYNFFNVNPDMECVRKELTDYYFKGIGDLKQVQIKYDSMKDI